MKDGSNTEPGTSHGYEKATLNWSRAAVVVAVVAALIILYQDLLIRRQLVDAEKSGATATDQTWKAIGNLNWIARSMDLSQKASAEASKEALAAAQDQMRVEQRAWIGMTFQRLDKNKEISEDHPLELVFQCPATVTNYGRTPARMISIHAQCARLSTGDSLAFGSNGLPRPYEAETLEYLQPDQPVDVSIASSIVIDGKPFPVVTTPQIWDQVANARVVVVAYGDYTYVDSFNQKHWVHFCHAYNRADGGPPQCLRYNESDQDSPRPRH